MLYPTELRAVRPSLSRILSGPETALEPGGTPLRPELGPACDNTTAGWNPGARAAERAPDSDRPSRREAKLNWLTLCYTGVHVYRVATKYGMASHHFCCEEL